MGRDSTKYSNFCFRITAPWDLIETQSKEIFTWIDYSGCMIGYHIGTKTEKEHAHFAIQLKSRLQRESLNVRLRSLFGVKGANYSSSAWDTDPQALRYMFHDRKGKVFNFLGYDQSIIDKLKAESEVITKAVEESKKKASKRLPDYVIGCIEAEGGNVLWTPEDIAYKMFQAVYESKFHNPGNTHFENYINEVMIKQCKSEEDLKRAWIERRQQLRILNLKPTW